MPLGSAKRSIAGSEEKLLKLSLSKIENLISVFPCRHQTEMVNWVKNETFRGETHTPSHSTFPKFFRRFFSSVSFFAGRIEVDGVSSCNSASRISARPEFNNFLFRAKFVLQTLSSQQWHHANKQRRALWTPKPAQLNINKSQHPVSADILPFLSLKRQQPSEFISKTINWIKIWRFTVDINWN